ncbi:F-box only protein 15-like [Diadema antillarum]|uniref:F-box only protein 15-like n=1 Tax=Diadema antillarum TaxID=105358 RepID=UPI003A85ED3F
MAAFDKHEKQLSDYLDKHRKQKKQGRTPPTKSATSTIRDKEGISLPSIEKLNINSAASPHASPKVPSASLSRAHQISGGAKPKPKTSVPVRTVARSAQPVRTLKRKATIHDLPTELLLHVFSFLPPVDLLTCVCVNRQWMELASDNILWQPLYERYAAQPTGKSSASPSKSGSVARPHPVYALHADIRWKTACIKECIAKRDSRIARLMKKKDPYSLLPASIGMVLEKIGVKWELVLVDSSKAESSFTHSDAIYFPTSSTVRWYSLNPPPVSSLRSLAVYAQAPVFFERDGSAAINSPSQRSLLLEHRIKPSDLTGEPVVRSQVINVYTPMKGIVIATWKDDGELAFVSLCVHHHGIIQRATLGTSQKMHIPVPIKPRPDDIDSQYGLHDYQCIMELRHQRNTLWSQRFDRLHANKNSKVDGHIRLTPVRGDVVTDHSYSSKRIQFPWKTDVFKGIVQDFAILDCTLYDEFQQPIWCVSCPVVIEEDFEPVVTMEYEGDPVVINYSDTKGNIEIRMFWVPEREQHVIVSVNIDLAVKTVNDWFGTQY